MTPAATPVVKAYGDWATNAHMIRDGVVPLGYLAKDRRTLDPTWGLGVFWKLWQPDDLVGSDLDATKNPPTVADACDLPHGDDSFDDVIIDGPYKLNGKPDIPVDSRYGVDVWSTAEGRMELVCRMMTEGARVLRPGGHLLVKCQRQVNSNRIWWQPRIFTEHGEFLGLSLIDELLFPSYRPQPKRAPCLWCGTKVMLRKDGRWGDENRSGPTGYECPSGNPHEGGELTQNHSAVNYSTLLILKAA